MATATTKRKSSTKPKTTGRVALAKMVSSPRKRAFPPGWTAWHGGQCPVSSESTVQVWFRHAPQPYRWGQIPSLLDWEHHASKADIVAYRVFDEPSGYLHLPKLGLTATETAAAARHGEAADAAEGSALVMRDFASSSEALTKAMHGLRSVVESAPRFDARSFAIGLTCGGVTVFLGLLLGRVLDAVL